MNKKLLAGLMSVVMLAGSCPTLGAHGVGKSKVSNNSVVRFVKNHKKIIVGMLVVGAGAGVGYYKREEVKKGFNTAKDKVNSLIKSKPAESKGTFENSTDTKVVVINLDQENKDQVEVQELETESETETEAAKIRVDMENIKSKIKKFDRRINSAKGSRNSKDAHKNKIREKIHRLEVKKSKFEIELRNKEMELKKYN